jgi:hypothetical protein
VISPKISPNDFSKEDASCADRELASGSEAPVREGRRGGVWYGEGTRGGAGPKARDGWGRWLCKCEGCGWRRLPPRKREKEVSEDEGEAAPESSATCWCCCNALADCERRSENGDVDDEDTEALNEGGGTGGGGGGAFARERCIGPDAFRGGTAMWVGPLGREEEGRGGGGIGTAGLCEGSEGRRSNCADAADDADGVPGFGRAGGGEGLGTVECTKVPVVVVGVIPRAPPGGRTASEPETAAGLGVELAAEPVDEGGTGLALARSVDLRDSSLSGMVSIGRRRIGRLYSDEAEHPSSRIGGTENGSFSAVLGAGSSALDRKGSNSISTDSVLGGKKVSPPRRIVVELVVVKDEIWVGVNNGGSLIR